MSELIQTGFDYGSLPTESALTARAAAERIKLRLKRTVEDIIEIGRELTAVKDQLPHGQFLPWIAAEFEMDQKTAFNFMSVSERFGGKLGIIPNFKPTILYALSAPSTPDTVIDKAIAKAESGEKVTVADVKDWKVLEAELNNERQARLIAEQRAREFGAESNDRRKEIRELKTQIDLLKVAEKPEPVVQVIEKEVIPPDYENAKEHAAELQRQTTELQRQLEALQKQQGKLVNDQVKAKMQGYQREVQEMENKKAAIQEQVDRMKAYMASLESDAKRIEVHHDVIEKSRLELISLAAFLSDMDPMTDADTVKRWIALSGMLDDASKSIRALFGNCALN